MSAGIFSSRAGPASLDQGLFVFWNRDTLTRPFQGVRSPASKCGIAGERMCEVLWLRLISEDGET